MTEPAAVGSWLRLDKEDVNVGQLKQQLHVVGYANASSNEPPPTVDMFLEDKKYIYVPRQAGFIPQSVITGAVDCTIQGDDRDFGDPIDMSSRPYQIDVVGKVMAGLNGKYPYGGHILAAAGGGKTIMGLEVMRRVGKTTLIMVHKTFLVNQWKERIEFFLPKARIGFVQQDQCDYGDDYDVVIAIVQSLAAREYPDAFYRWPGHVLIDELHRFASATFHPAIVDFPAKVRLGLTATPNRKDGMSQVFVWHIGPVLAEVERGVAKVFDPLVRVIEYEDPHYYAPRFKMYDGKFNLAKWVTYITEDVQRNNMILKIILNALAKGRKIILFSDRREHLNYLQEALQDCGYVVDQYVGGRKQAALDIAAKADVILATFSMGAEGLDIPDIDVEILATPKADVEQAVGRAQRPFPGKPQPIVIDIVDIVLGMAKGLLVKRRRIYAKLNATYV